ncbi:hypothetical protein KH5_07570 [Urechidicola sp. KH5]
MQSQTTNVGIASYTNTFPGTDSAGRNGFPPGSPQLSGTVASKPVPTNDWWSKLVFLDHADNLFNYPMTMKTTNNGLIVTYIPWGVIGDSAPIQVGLTGLSATKTTVSDFSDWTVTMNWNDGSHELKATSGIGMPFLYFEKDLDDEVSIQINSGTVTVTNEIITIENAAGGADFAIYAPVGSSWTESGNTYTSTLNGETYWSMAMLPQATTNVASKAIAYQDYAYVFPTNTTADWSFNESTSKVITSFNVTTDVKDGSATNTNILLGLLPHQWDNLAATSATPNGDSYDGVRGEIKTLIGNSFTVENTFKGILPTMPDLANYSPGFSPSELSNKIALIENDELATWTDSYNEGQVMNRLIQTARIADQMGDTDARDTMIATIKERLEDWLTYQSGEVAFLFYYNDTWSAMLGYPAGHGQDTNINDHHFHWGYFIHAAAFMEQFEPGWADDWGDMINLLIRDAASADRDDTQFPFLRNFSPYGGHCWANGSASFPQGNDQESTSESMQFNSSLIHWGTITENDAIRDLGIYLYTTEQTAVEEYWFDMNERNFQPTQPYSLVSRVWGNSYDNGTFWTSDITASYGIELYPMHGGSLYLGHNTDYVQTIWDELQTYTGILSDNDTNPNLWHDTIWKYLSFLDPERAIELYDAYPDRILKFGVSDAQTYHWLHVMNALGQIDATITANYPIAAAFYDEDLGFHTYVAHNYGDSDITVTFSDGFMLDVPANTMVTSRDTDVSGVLSSNFTQAFPGGSVDLSVVISGAGVTKVAFYDGNTLLGEDTTAPYEQTASNLTLGVHGMYARVYEGTAFSVTNIVDIQVGEQVSYTGTPSVVPGTIEAGHYDVFEGGIGQNIAYLDLTQNNQGDFRTDEYVDAEEIVAEGAIVGWVSGGEWIEYSIDVQTAGNYDVDVRYASGNSIGGGPIYFEIEGTKVSPDISFSDTGDWDTWSTKSVSNVALNEGQHVLRLVSTNGEFNIGRMTFTYGSALGYNPPVANAGDNVSVILPTTTATLDGSLSSDIDTPVLNYQWEQIYGPSTILFSDSTVVSPDVSNLEEGIYKVQLTVDDGTYSSISTTLIIVTLTGNVNPVITLTSPENATTYVEGDNITIEAQASDLDGTISVVEFYEGATKIGEDTTAPYSFEWVEPAIGDYDISAKAIDNAGGESTSSIASVSVEELTACEATGTDAQQGSFSIGYKSMFETIGNDVKITFELLDTDKTGVVAYLWQESPFAETAMDHVSGNIFTKTVSGHSLGETISYACKFAFAGGLAVTEYISYEVGSNCSGGGGSDSVAPTNFTAQLGTVQARSVELLLSAEDDSGNVVYDIVYGTENATASGASGEEVSKIINALEPETSYTFSITAKDLAGNIAANSPIEIMVTTGSNVNTACSGTDSEAQQGSFDVGYTYDFSTSGNEVTFTFELLDDKTGVVAYLWRESPFAEFPMSLVSGKTFSTTISGFTPGETISYACKFAFAGGLAVTKYFSYEVGQDCAGLSVDGETLSRAVKVYPNPASNNLFITSDIFEVEKVEVYSTLGQKIVLKTDVRSGVDVSNLSNGVYLLKVHIDNRFIYKRFIKN